MPPCHEPFPQPVIVVELTVADERDVAVLVQHGLVALGRQVDDRQPAMAEERVAVSEHALAVGAAPGEPREHRVEDALALEPCAGQMEARDPAHG